MESDLKLEQQHNNGGAYSRKNQGDRREANSEGIERHREALRAIVKKVESVKTQIELAKVEIAFKLTS